MDRSYDVVIAGGAAMGSSLAYHLAADTGFKGRVLVVEKDFTYAKAATSLSLSSIRQQFSQSLNIRVGLAGMAFLRNARQTLAVDGDGPDLPVVENGYLYLATDPEALRANHAVQIAEGADVALLSPDQLKAQFPWLNVEGVALGSFGRSGEGWFDSYTLMQAFRRKATSLGATYVQDEVVGFKRDGARVTGARLAQGGEIGCGAFVNCAGASGAARLAAALGTPIPVEARKRCVFVFEARQIDKFPLLIDPSGVYVRPEGRHYLIGGPPPDPDPDTQDFEVDWPMFEEALWPVLAARVPAFESLKLVRAWAGHYDLNIFDHNALVGRLPGLDNAYLAAGFSGHGVQQSPAVGRGLAELIVHGGYRTLDLGDFAFERIAAGRPMRERNVI